MHIEIQKAEISSRIFLKWEYEEQVDGRKTKHKASSDAPIHDDLSNAIQALVPHFVLLTEMKKKPDVVKVMDLGDLPEELLSKFKVKGIAIEDNKGDISYRISGMKFLKNGKSVSFETPKTDMGTDDDAYEFWEDLERKVETIKEEVLEYMNGKQAISNQTAMDFDEEEFDPSEDDQGAGDFVSNEQVA